MQCIGIALLCKAIAGEIGFIGSFKNFCFYAFPFHSRIFRYIMEYSRTFQNFRGEFFFFSSTLHIPVSYAVLLNTDRDGSTGKRTQFELHSTFQSACAFACWTYTIGIQQNGVWKGIVGRSIEKLVCAAVLLMTSVYGFNPLLSDEHWRQGSLTSVPSVLLSPVSFILPFSDNYSKMLDFNWLWSKCSCLHVISWQKCYGH